MVGLELLRLCQRLRGLNAQDDPWDYTFLNSCEYDWLWLEFFHLNTTPISNIIMSMNSKSRRKFRVWDNKLLFQTYQQAIQVKEKIEELCGDKLNPEDLPNSAVPTDTLYTVMACYEAMYDKLLEEDLLQAGWSTKSSKSYH